MSADALPPWSEVPESWTTLAGNVGEEDPNSYDDQVAVFDRWQIATVDEAEWAMQHVAHASEQINRVDAQRALWQDKLDRWYADSTREPRRTVEFFEGHLQRWGQAQREADPKVATLRLPSGDVSTRQAKQPQIVVVDEHEFIEWALTVTAPVAYQPPEIVARGDESEWLTFAEIGCVRTRHEPRVSIIRDVVKIVPRDQVTTWSQPEHGEFELPEQVPAAVFGDGLIVSVVPGLGVEEPRVTASVKPRPAMEGST